MSSRDKILARRAKFIAAAFASAGLAACSSETTGSPQVCLEPAIDGSVDARDAADTQPQACLTPEFDSGTADSTTDVVDSGADTRDTGPMPGDTRTDADGGADSSDTGPMPCLSPLPDSGSE